MPAMHWIRPHIALAPLPGRFVSVQLVERDDLAISRYDDRRRYVQHVLRDAADTLRTWVDDGAAIYVCGSLQGMAPGVHAALVEVLGEARMEALATARRYRRDVY